MFTCFINSTKISSRLLTSPTCGLTRVCKTQLLGAEGSGYKVSVWGDGHVLELGARGLERVGNMPADRAEVSKMRFAPKLVLFPYGVHMEVSFGQVI